jgi:hypothetical protein
VTGRGEKGCKRSDGAVNRHLTLLARFSRETVEERKRGRERENGKKGHLIPRSPLVFIPFRRYTV